MAITSRAQLSRESRLDDGHEDAPVSYAQENEEYDARVRYSASLSSKQNQTVSAVPMLPQGRSENTYLHIYDEDRNPIVLTHRINLAGTHIFKNDERALIGYADERFGFIAVYPEKFAMNFMIRDIKKRFRDGMVAVFRDIDERTDGRTVDLVGVVAFKEGGNEALLDSNGRPTRIAAKIAEGPYLAGALAPILHSSLRKGLSVRDVDALFSQPYSNVAPTVVRARETAPEIEQEVLRQEEAAHDSADSSNTPPPIQPQYQRETFARQSYKRPEPETQKAEKQTASASDVGAQSHGVPQQTVNDTLELYSGGVNKIKIHFLCTRPAVKKDHAFYKEYISDSVLEITTPQGGSIRDNLVAIVSTESDKVFFIAQSEREHFYSLNNERGRIGMSVGTIAGALSTRPGAKRPFFLRGRLERLKAFPNMNFFVNFGGDHAEKVETSLYENYERLKAYVASEAGPTEVQKDVPDFEGGF